MIMSLYKIIKYQLYLLQLENYELGRYFGLLWKKGFLPRGEQRKGLVWTTKAKALLLMALGLHILVGVLFFWAAGLPAEALTKVGDRPYIYIIAVLVWVFLFTIYYLLFTIALMLLWPFDFFAKHFIVWQAKSKILNLKSKIKIIGIAGSYGKTTMKEVLKQVLGSRFKVQATSDSVNTPVGIARWILKNVDEATEIIIVEMGEHYRGDVEDICNISKPDIAVVTGINEAHLERMGTMENAAATIFEIVGGLKPKGLAVLNADDKNVMGNYKKYITPDYRVAIFGRNPKSEIRNPKFDQGKLGWEIEILEIGKVFVNLLGEYALGDVDAAMKIARELGMTSEEIKKGIEKIKPVEHRLQAILSANGVLVIDDAYNGNPEGVKEAIKVLSRFEGRRKVYITPGLVEMGSSTAEIHREIGKQLAGVADVVTLIKNSVTSDIELGIRNYELGMKPQIIWFDNAQEAHAGLKDILKPGDVVIFQNDWGDQYT